MLALIFRIDEAKYAVDCRPIVEVVPRVSLRPIPGSPAYVAGAFLYGAEPVPTIDLCRLIADRASPSLMSCRILVVRDRAVRTTSRDRTRTVSLLGLLTPGATEIRDIPKDDMLAAGAPGTVPYLGRIVALGGEILQRVDVAAVARMAFEACPTLSGEEAPS